MTEQQLEEFDALACAFRASPRTDVAALDERFQALVAFVDAAARRHAEPIGATEAGQAPLRIFIGYDPRQPLAYNVLQHSIARHASLPVAITPLILRQLPLRRRGLTEFTFSRFLVPWLCGFEGQAVFMDADMVVVDDVVDLFNSASAAPAPVSVVQNQPRFEWASMMVFDCSACTVLTPEFVDDPENVLFDFAWAPSVGALPEAWNRCVGYSDPAPDAKLLHFTQGLPCFWETRGRPEDAAWDVEKQAMLHSVGWRELMGGSVHAQPVLRRLFDRYKRHELQPAP